MMKRGAFTLIEMIFVIVIIAIIAAVAVPKFINLTNRSIVNKMTQTLTTGLEKAVETAINKRHLEDDNDFKLVDLLYITSRELTKDLEWHYTETGSYNKYGTYSLRDLSYSTPQVVMRVTLNRDDNSIQYKVDCTNLKVSTHGDLRELCIERWGADVVEVDVPY